MQCDDNLSWQTLFNLLARVNSSGCATLNVISPDGKAPTEYNRELREDGSFELREDNGIELRQ